MTNQYEDIILLSGIRSCILTMLRLIFTMPLLPSYQPDDPSADPHAHEDPAANEFPVPEPKHPTFQRDPVGALVITTTTLKSTSGTLKHVHLPFHVPFDSPYALSPLEEYP